MADGPAFRGDASTPHAREGNFTAFIGGCWVMLGLQFTRDIMEFRPAWRCVYSVALRIERNKDERLMRCCVAPTTSWRSAKRRTSGE
jgi:hypothetical protein